MSFTRGYRIRATGDSRSLRSFHAHNCPARLHAARSYDCRMFGFGGLKKNGVPATAVVQFAQPRHQIASNEFRKFDFVVDVQPEGREPFRAEIVESFWLMGLKPGVGDVVKVRYDAKNLKTVFDLKGDPRYDMDEYRRRKDAEKEALLRGDPGASAYYPPPEDTTDR